MRLSPSEALAGPPVVFPSLRECPPSFLGNTILSLWLYLIFL